MTKAQQDKLMADYNRLVLGDVELVKVKDPVNGVRAKNTEGCFVFLREISGETITQVSPKQKSLRSKGQVKPGHDDNNIRIKDGGYKRRKEAARYLGISLRTLTDWQQRRIIPFIDVSHRVTLFRLADLDKAMSRFIVKAIGEEA